jgi:hypothetical protein
VEEVNNIDNINLLYVKDYYRPLTRDELEEEDRSFTLEDLYVIQNIDIKKVVENGETILSSKKVFYPFIGSSFCCLEEGVEYYYYYGAALESSTTPSTLNGKDLKTLY